MRVLPLALFVASGSARAADPYLSLGWTLESNQPNTYLGISASAGDVDQDGFDDVLIGMPFSEDGETDEGRVVLYLGSSLGLSASVAWSADADQAEAYFGSSVGAAGDVNGDGFVDVFVGAPYFDGGSANEGRVSLFLGGPAGLAATPAWTAEPDIAYGYFGDAVAPAGDVNGDGFDDLLIGSAHATSQGRAYVYLGSPSGLQLTPGWTPDGEVPGSFFGASVAGAGDVDGDGYDDVLIGAPSYAEGYDAERGRVYLYRGSAAGLSTSQAWTATGDADLAGLGSRVSGAGDVNGDGFADLLVQAQQYDGYTFEAAGRVSLFLGSPAGPSMTEDWSASSDQTFPAFGFALAAAGDVDGDGYDDVVLGAPYTSTYQGRAYVYMGSAGGLNNAPAWTADGPAQGSSAYFGGNVAAAGDVNGDGRADVLVGASGFADGEGSEGAVFLYLSGCDGGAGDNDGDGVDDACDVCPGADDALFDTDHDGACALPGAVLDCDDTDGWSHPAAPERCDGRDNACVGLLHEFDADLDGDGALLCDGDYDEVQPNLTLAWAIEGGQPDSSFGWSVAGAGDVNGDGYADLIVGAPGFDDGWNNEGAVSLFLGSEAGLSPSPWSAEGGVVSVYLGMAVASAGDVDADGFDDVLVGAPYYADGVVGSGRASLFLGSAAGLEPTAAWTADRGAALGRFGQALASAGDVNGDGYDDVIVGDWLCDQGEFAEGCAFLYLGSAAGLEDTPAWTVGSDVEWAALGSAVASAGDVNGDGYDDVVVGATGYVDEGIEQGAAFVYLGSPAGPDMEPAWVGLPGRPQSEYGSAVAAGDVNGDGYSDVVVGAYGYDDGAYEEGAVFVYLGSAFGLALEPAWTVVSSARDGMLGWSVAVGDVNGDGYSDIVASEPQWDALAPRGSRARVYLGAPDGLDPFPTWAEPGPVDLDGGSGSGVAVAFAGDVDGDGADDVLVGAPGDGVAGVVSLYAGYPCVPDTDGDGVCDRVDRCPGANDAVDDADGDGACATKVPGVAADCDDADPNVYPGAPESCDGIDSACDGLASEVDADADGFIACAECDDADAATYPGAPEQCDGKDNACAGGLPSDEGDADADGFLACAECDDAEPTAHPGQDESCDGLDNNCDGAADEGCPSNTSPSGCGCAGNPQAAGALTGWLGLLALVRRRRR